MSAAVELYCEKCEKVTPHTHIIGRLCLCSTVGCGTEHTMPADMPVPEKQKPQGTELPGREQQEQIAARYLAGEGEADLAKEFGVTGKLVRSWVSAARKKARAAGETKPAAPETKEAKGETKMPKCNKLTDADKAEICKL